MTDYSAHDWAVQEARDRADDDLLGEQDRAERIDWLQSRADDEELWQTGTVEDPTGPVDLTDYRDTPIRRTR